MRHKGSREGKRQKQKQIAAAACCPLSRARERVARQRRVRERSSAACLVQAVFPHSPPSAGLSPARGREEKSKPAQLRRSAAKRSEPIAFDVQPLAAPAGVARAGGSRTGRPAERRRDRMSRRRDPEHVAPAGDPFVGFAVERARTSGRAFFARAKKVTPGREGQNPQRSAAAAAIKAPQPNHPRVCAAFHSRKAFKVFSTCLSGLKAE
jgi:hypothetical protein